MRDGRKEPAGLLPREDFSRLLAEACKSEVRIRLTHNRSSLLTVRKNGRDGVEVSVQHAFRAAGPKEMEALARFVDGPDARSRKLIGAFLQKNRDLVSFFARPKQPATPGDPMLAAVLDRICSEYGLSGQGLSIGWSRARTKPGRRRSIRLGCYRHADKSIRIHPILKSREIPDYFLDYIVYHEALHAELEPLEAGGKTIVHHALFRRRERGFRHYDQARRFEKRFVAEVLAGRWKG